MTIHNSLAELIGNTPLVKLNHIPQAAGVKATITVKVEYFNPVGSSNDWPIRFPAASARTSTTIRTAR